MLPKMWLSYIAMLKKARRRNEKEWQTKVNEQHVEEKQTKIKAEHYMASEGRKAFFDLHKECE